jgi:hypothetical protein
VSSADWIVVGFLVTVTVSVLVGMPPDPPPPRCPECDEHDEVEDVSMWHAHEWRCGRCRRYFTN